MSTDNSDPATPQYIRCSRCGTVYSATDTDEHRLICVASSVPSAAYADGEYPGRTLSTPGSSVGARYGDQESDSGPRHRVQPGHIAATHWNNHHSGQAVPNIRPAHQQQPTSFRASDDDALFANYQTEQNPRYNSGSEGGQGRPMGSSASIGFRLSGSSFINSQGSRRTTGNSASEGGSSPTNNSSGYFTALDSTSSRPTHSSGQGNTPYYQTTENAPPGRRHAPASSSRGHHRYSSSGGASSGYLASGSSSGNHTGSTSASHPQGSQSSNARNSNSAYPPSTYRRT